MIKPSNIQPNLIAQISPIAAEMKSAMVTIPNVEEDLAAMWGEIADGLRNGGY